MRGSIESRGIQSTLCPYKEDSRFILARETGNRETNMAEADLSPTTFTSRSARDPDYDISTEDSSKNENENTYTEASSDNSSSDPETESNAKSVQSPQEFDDAKVKDKAKADLSWIKLSSRRTDQIAENNLQEMAGWLFSAVFVKVKKQRALNTD